MMFRNAPAAQAAQAEERFMPPANSRETRFAGFAPQSYDADARTVEVILSVGASVKRWGFIEELEISAAAIDLSRVAAGLCPLLDSHNSYELDAVLGRVENVRVDGTKLLGTLRFADTERGREIEARVARGELRGISIGYSVTKWERVAIDAETGIDTWRAVAWELLEASLVPVPADPSAGVRSAGSLSPGNPGGHATIEEEEDMLKRNLPGAAAPAAPAVTIPADQAEQQRQAAAAAPAVPAAEPAQGQQRAAPVAQLSRFTAGAALAFVEQARAFGDAVATRAGELVQQNERGEISEETARSTLLGFAAEQQRAATGNLAAGGRSIPAQPTRHGTNEEGSRSAIADALIARSLRQQPSDAGRQFMGYRLLEIAAMRAGLDPRERDPNTILRAANTTSDFPLLLEAAANKILLARYETAQPTYQRIARRRDLTDFKTTKLLRVGDFPTLVAYSEDGEIKSGTINEGRETVILGSYGRILTLTRQAIINDDLGAFDEVFGSVGNVIARFENSLFFTIKAQNSGNGPKLADNVNFFNSAHGNLASSGGALSVTTLGAGRAAMMKQKDLDGNPLNIPPSIMLVGPDQQTAAEQFTSPISAIKGDDINPFAGKLDVVSDANITGNAWELYASPEVLPGFNYGYLADAPGPRIMTEEGFNWDGMRFRVTEDFYAAPTDYRAGYRNPGP